MMIFLEKEILAALENAGIHFLSFVRISNFHLVENSRSCYRVNHVHGTVKVRLLENESMANELAAFRRELPDDFAPVIFQQGRVLIEDWIVGDPLPNIPEPRWLEAAGIILGNLHARRSVGHRMLHEVHRSVSSWCKKKPATLYGKWSTWG